MTNRWRGYKDYLVTLRAQQPNSKLQCDLIVCLANLEQVARRFIAGSNRRQDNLKIEKLV